MGKSIKNYNGTYKRLQLQIRGITLSDVANNLEIDVSLVSRVLNPNSDAKSRRVVEEIERLIKETTILEIYKDIEINEFTQNEVA